MTPIERKAAFRLQADRDLRTLAGAAHEVCGVTWEHLSEGIKDGRRPLSDDVKQKFAAYIGLPVDEVFGTATVGAA